MNPPSAPRPGRPSASSTNGSGDDDVPLDADQIEPALCPADGLIGEPDRQDGSGQPGDGEDNDEYEPL